MTRKRKFKFRPAPKVRCDNGQYIGGPHPGCSEFAPDTWVQCRKPATHVVKYTAMYPEAPGEVREKVLACAEHVSHFGPDDEYVKDIRPYRFRYV